MHDGSAYMRQPHRGKQDCARVGTRAPAQPTQHRSGHVAQAAAHGVSAEQALSESTEQRSGSLLVLRTYERNAGEAHMLHLVCTSSTCRAHLEVSEEFSAHDSFKKHIHILGILCCPCQIDKPGAAALQHGL
jgi:hypothetical protein